VDTLEAFGKLRNLREGMKSTLMQPNGYMTTFLHGCDNTIVFNAHFHITQMKRTPWSMPSQVQNSQVFFISKTLNTKT
jgi:hypothetical protein